MATKKRTTRTPAGPTMTHEERLRLINRPFFITHFPKSYPWAGALVPAQTIDEILLTRGPAFRTNLRDALGTIDAATFEDWDLAYE